MVAERALVDRLDEAVGVEGWSRRLLPLGADAVVCELELLGVRKSAVAASFGGVIDMPRVCAWAFGRAAALLGMTAPAVEAVWVEFDVDSGLPLEPPEVAHVPGAGAASQSGSTAQPVAAPAVGAAASDERSEGRQAIDRLVERLRGEGLGQRAAALVVEHGGYGHTAQEARELYRKLRELMLEKGALS
ncbi:MAG: hypothetical protein P8Z81_06565 [Deinococcales bacterium]